MAADRPSAASQEQHVLPVLTIRNRVLFPHTALRLALGRPASRALVNAEFSDVAGDLSKVPRYVAIVTVVDKQDKQSGSDANTLYTVGCIARVVRLVEASKHSNDSNKKKSSTPAATHLMWVQGTQRLRVLEYTQTRPYRKALVKPLVDSATMGTKESALALNLARAAKEYVQLLKENSGPMALSLSDVQLDKLGGGDPSRVAFALVGTSRASVQEKQEVLAEDTLEGRLTKALVVVSDQVEVLKVSSKIQRKVSDKLKSRQREFYLKQQLEAIKKELGDDDSDEDDVVAALQKRLAAVELPQKVEQVAFKELRRLKRMNPQLPEHSMVVTYLEWIADLPWGKHSASPVTLQQARKQLDNDHFGLDRVKQRVLEFLAVRMLNPTSPGPILCLVGPPGVGKTSLGRSIAAALGREFHRISLGGLRDVAEIRGHRRTYIGALPGTFIQMMKRSSTADPVVLLDEIDKLGRDVRGDPSSALLEVLDPEQNSTFTDHYLGVPFDLSRVVFVATANESDPIPPALYDRMEIIRLSGYTLQEKLAIARAHLWPKQLAAHSLTDGVHASLDDSALAALATEWTREAGVRGLERALAAVCRAVAVQLAAHRFPTRASMAKLVSPTGEEQVPITTGAVEVASDGMDEDDSGDAAVNGDVRIEDEGAGAVAVASDGTAKHDAPAADAPVTDAGFECVAITRELITQALGPAKFELKPLRAADIPGVVTGLAWTPTGGQLLYIEATTMAGSGLVKLTGQLGDVMQESAHTALSWIRSHAQQLGLPANPVKDRDVHIHFPAGAIPKDGPSAGAAITMALLSTLTGRVARADTAMTGEITLQGSILPVGGIKEKLLAAHRRGIVRILLPKRNESSLDELPDGARSELEVHLVSNIEEVISLALQAPATATAAAATTTASMTKRTTQPAKPPTLDTPPPPPPPPSVGPAATSSSTTRASAGAGAGAGAGAESKLQQEDEAFSLFASKL